MNDHNKPTEMKNIACEICLKEVPHSDCHTTEVDDYFVHFCGLECYEKWRQDEADKELKKSSR